MHKIDTEQLEFIDYRLRKIMDQVEERFGPQVITSLYRIRDLGVHGTLPLRGIDLRSHKKEVDDVIVRFVNERWTYDPNRPLRDAAMAHDTGRGYHIHLQTHPNTKER